MELEGNSEENFKVFAIRCSHCGTAIGELTLVQGSQVVGCPKCSKKTKVEVSLDGTVNSYPLY